MTYCSNCGSEVQSGDAYCDECGTEVGVIADERTAEEEWPPKERRDPPPEDHRDPTRGESGSVGDLSGYTTGQKVGIVGSGVATVGAFLPWITVTVLGTTVTKRGIEADGQITLVLAVVAAVVTFVRWGKIAKAGVVLLGAIVALIGLMYIGDPTIGTGATVRQSALRNAFQPGVGLYITALGGALIASGPAYDALQ